MNRISRTLLLTLLQAARLIPLPVRAQLGRILGRLYALFPLREREIVIRHLALFKGKFKASVQVREVFSHLGETALESINLTPILKNRDSAIICREQPLLNELLNEKGGTLVLTGHVGNWDLLGAYGASLGVPLATVARKARQPLLQDALIRLRAETGVTMLWKDDPGIGRDILRRLKEREWIAALIDQDTTVKGESSPFLGIPAHTPTTIIELGKRAKARIIIAFLVRVGCGRYEVTLKRVEQSLTVSEILKAYHESLEGILKEYPAQWVWNHKRWRTLPSGERLSSREYLNWLHANTKL